MTVLTSVREADLSPDQSTGQRLVIIAHGSPDPRHRRSVARLGQRLAALTGRDVTVSFLEHDSPRAHEVLAAPATPQTHTVVLPLLVTAGVHWRDDIPPVLAHDGSRSVLLPPPPPAAFETAVRPLVAGAAHVILASAGSSQPQVISRFAALADLLGPAEVEVCLTPQDVATCARPDSTVVPFLTADGVFADRIRRAAAAAHVTPVVGDTQGFARILADLVGSAVDQWGQVSG